MQLQQRLAPREIKAQNALEGTMFINGKEAKVLFDTGMIGANLISARFVTTYSRALGKCWTVVQDGPERSWSTEGVCGPRGPPGPLRSILIHSLQSFTENVD